VADPVQICNVALSRIGHREPIASLDDKSEEAVVCNAIFQTVRDSLLGAWPWPFSIKHTALSLLIQPAWASTTVYSVGQKVTYDSSGRWVSSLTNGNVGNQPSGNGDPTWSVANPQAREGWAYMYQVPSDKLVARGIYAGIRQPRTYEKIPYTIEASDDLMGEVLLSDMVSPVLLYTAALPIQRQYPPVWSNAMAWVMAWELAGPLRVDEKFKTEAAQQAKGSILEAFATAKNESHELEPVADGLAARGDHPIYQPSPGNSATPEWWPY